MLELYFNENTDDIINKPYEYYRNIPVISQSMLKDMDYDPSVLIKQEKKKNSKYLDKGNILDLVILNSNNIETYDDVVKQLSDKLLLNTLNLKIPEYSTKLYDVLDYIVVNDIETTNENILFACSLFEYYPNYTPEKKISIINDNAQVISFMKEAYKKTITSIEDIHEALYAKKMFNEFMKSKFRNYDECSKLYQFFLLEKINLPEFYNIDSFFGKGAVDNILIDHVDRKIHLIDLKTGSSIYFFDSFFSFKYYYQLPFYAILLKEYFKRHDIYLDYDFEMHYIYISTKNYIPIKYTLTNNAIKNIYAGGTVKSKEIKALFDILNDYYYYITEKKFDAPKYFYDNQFEFSIDE